MFQKGDVIVHPKYGVGTVSDVRTMSYKGSERQYFCISLIHNRGELMIPKDRVEQAGLRLPLRDTAIFEAIMKDSPHTLEDDPRIRQQVIENKLNSGDYRQLMETLRDLCWREHIAKLSVKDRQLKESALNRLYEELTLGTAMTGEAAKHTLADIIESAMQRHLAAGVGAS
ncbi:MAG: CarD family transcriptional regulator [Anaerolineae bacterium]